LFGDAADNDVGYVLYSHGSDIMNFKSNATDGMSLEGNKLLIGAFGSPAQTLTVQGTLNVTADGSAGPNLFVESSGNVGIGTATPGMKLEVAGNFNASSVNATDYLIVNNTLYVNNTKVGIGTGSTNPGIEALHVRGNVTIDGHLNITGNISSPGNLKIYSYENKDIIIDAGSGEVVFGDGTAKIDAGTIDPLFNIGGKTYATYVPSIIGVKEEITGMAATMQQGDEFKFIIDFNKEENGSDLWVWGNIIDFSKENIDVIATPYGDFANIYYYIEDNKIIFVSDKEVEFSYRLTGKRFDHEEWETAVPEKDGRGFKVD
jgi:hypothetical protein